MREMPVRMRNLCPRDDGVVAVSGGVAADTERLMDMPAGRVTAIFNPVYRPQILALADAAAPHPWLQTDSLPVVLRSEEHTSELQSLMRISYAVFCLTKKKTRTSSS